MRSLRVKASRKLATVLVFFGAVALFNGLIFYGRGRLGPSPTTNISFRATDPQGSRGWEGQGAPGNVDTTAVLKERQQNSDAQGATGHAKFGGLLRGALRQGKDVVKDERFRSRSRRTGEAAMLYDFGKVESTSIDLDDVKEGHMWVPISVDRFGPNTRDPRIKMCQVDYAKYSSAPWELPMGGLLAQESGCNELVSDSVKVVKLSVLERALVQSPIEPSSPTGFFFHETRCGSTLVANMLASRPDNVMWSESTGPWKLMHTCPKCPKAQVVRFLRVIMHSMTRSPAHQHFYFKFQSSEDIDLVTAAFPGVPWVFLFREPIEVLMSRLGAQRIGMEGMEEEVAAKVEKGMKAGPTKRGGGRPKREVEMARQLSILCKKAITAYENHPGMGMMVEYPHLPQAVLDTVLPDHFGVNVSKEEYEAMMKTTNMYSKVANYKKGEVGGEFHTDVEAKQDAANQLVHDMADKYLYPVYGQLLGLQTWLEVEVQ